MAHAVVGLRAECGPHAHRAACSGAACLEHCDRAGAGLHRSSARCKRFHACRDRLAQRLLVAGLLGGRVPARANVHRHKSPFLAAQHVGADNKISVHVGTR